MQKLNLAVVGCGLQGELVHLPALACSDLFKVSVLVDKSISRARAVAERYRVPAAVDDFREVVGKADAALVALPNYLHAPVAVDLLSRGIHVLVEKPMALNSQQCDQMIEAAIEGRATLAVGLDFRFPHTSQWVHRILQRGLLGDLRRFDLRLGNDLTWLPLKSDYLLCKHTAGGGVLIDLAVHAVDLILWWLGDCQHLQYYDDAMGGVEANCELQLRLRSGVTGIIEASRTRKLRNTCIIEGDRASLEIGLWDLMGQLRLRVGDHPVVLSAEDNIAQETWEQVFCRQLDDFAQAIVHGRPPFVSGAEGRRSVELIENCYLARMPLTYPWLEHDRCAVDAAAAGNLL